MKTTSSQKNLYMLALVLLAAAIALACAWAFLGDGEAVSDAVVPPAPAPDSAGSPAAVTPVPDAAPQAPADDAPTMSAVVYYQDNHGYLVPVMCRMPLQDGIAKATLNMMVQSPQNDMNAARLGLRTVIPENTTFDLDIADGVARIDLSREVLEIADAAAEHNMVTAIVQTLTEFDSVKQVEFLVEGRALDSLTHGTDISKPFERGEINLETADAAQTSSMIPLQLYFPCGSGSVVVPVTRMVYANADVNTAVLEFAKGPGAQSPLEGALPAGCGLIGVDVKDGVARVNFTREFARLVENTDGGRMALRALVLTCTQFEGINEVEIYVEGEAYDAGEGMLSVPSFANVADDIVYDYIQAQSDMIFEFE